MLGYIGPAEKAMIARVSGGLLNPGRIGLLAVESLALNIPILATTWHYHGPEYEYLTLGRDVYISADDVDSYAELILKAAGDGAVPVSYGEDKQSQFPTIDAMIDNFATGVREMIGT